MAGLKTCTRLRAMRARRRRRISSSLLPENIGPQTISIHPMWPVTSSMTVRCQNSALGGAVIGSPLHASKAANAASLEDRSSGVSPLPESDARKLKQGVDLLFGSINYAEI